jgi:hypothetical protein
VAHVEAQSQVCNCHRDTPVRSSSRLATERRNTCSSRRVITRLSIQNNLCHVLRQAAHSHLVLVILWVQREPRGTRRGWRAERCHRRRDCCHRRRDKRDRRFHKSLGALSTLAIEALAIEALAIEALSCDSINHDGITVFIILKEEVTRKGEGREEGRQSERHFG